METDHVTAWFTALFPGRFIALDEREIITVV